MRLSERFAEYACCVTAICGITIFGLAMLSLKTALDDCSGIETVCVIAQSDSGLSWTPAGTNQTCAYPGNEERGATRCYYDGGCPSEHCSMSPASKLLAAAGGVLLICIDACWAAVMIGRRYGYVTMGPTEIL